MYKYELYDYVNSSHGRAISHRTTQNVWDKTAELMAGSGVAIRTPANLRRKKETWFPLVKQKVRYYFVCRINCILMLASFISHVISLRTVCSLFNN